MAQPEKKRGKKESCCSSTLTAVLDLSLLLAQLWVTLRGTFLPTNGFRWQAWGHGGDPQHLSQQEPSSLIPSAPDWTFPTNSLSTTQTKCFCSFLQDPRTSDTTCEEAGNG